MEIPKIEQACALCGAFIIQNDRRGNKQSSYQPPHSADECPLRENPAQMISVLQTLNNELTSYPMREIVHSSRLIRVALRKAMIECALHQSGAGISMNGSIISSFHFPAERLQRAVNPQSQNTKPSHSPSLLLSHQPGLNNSSTGRGKRRRANSVLDCTPTRNELSTPLQPSSASNDGRPLEVSAATGQSFSHGYHQGENSSFQFDLDEYQRQDDWSEHKHRRQKQHSITIDNKTLPVRIHAPMYTIDVINNQDKQTDAANALPAYSNHHSFAEEDFEGWLK
jgi:hypothetical protein